jgi:hypothetical protein
VERVHHGDDLLVVSADRVFQAFESDGENLSLWRWSQFATTSVFSGSLN